MEKRAEPWYAPLSQTLWQSVVQARMPTLSTPARRDAVTQQAVADARQAAARRIEEALVATFPTVRDQVTADVAAIQQAGWFRGTQATAIIRHWRPAGNVQQTLKSWRDSGWLRRGDGPPMHAGDLCAILIALALVASDDSAAGARPAYGVFSVPPPDVRWWAWDGDLVVPADPLPPGLPPDRVLETPWTGAGWRTPGRVWRIRPSPTEVDHTGAGGADSSDASA